MKVKHVYWKRSARYHSSTIIFTIFPTGGESGASSIARYMVLSCGMQNEKDILSDNSVMLDLEDGKCHA